MVSHSVRHVALRDRSEEALEWMWQDVPQNYRPLPVRTDGLQVYQSLFEGTDHDACDKGSGKTSIVEALNTKTGETAFHRGVSSRAGSCAAPAAYG